MRLRVPICLSGSLIVPLLLAAFVPLAARAQSVYSKIEGGPLFLHWRAQVERMVATGDEPINHVCIVGWRDKADVDVQQAYVIWPEQHRLIT